MTEYDYLIFDLDGTISDPKEGMVKSVNYALECHGFETRHSEELEKFIGPPLDQTFSTIINSTDTNQINALVKKYRERYAETGYAENVLYDGIASELNKLFNNKNIRLGVCTSKHGDFAEKILEMFELRQYFSFVSGGDVGIHKWQQLKSLLNDKTITTNSVMIGDRYLDLEAAHKNGMSSAGVLWGYGSQEELMREKPQHLLSTPTELSTLVPSP